MAFEKISEQPSLYNDLEKKSVGELLRDINNEDKKVALAVEKANASRSRQPCRVSSSAFSMGERRALSPPAIMPITHDGSMPNVGGISEASSTPRRPDVPAPI